MIAILLFLTLDGPTAAARLDELRQQLAARGKVETMRELERLAVDAPGTEAGARASLWLADLEQQAGDRPGAKASYLRARPMGGELESLAERGLGDLAMLDGRYVEARRHFDAASLHASTLLRAELDQKRALASRLHVRALGAYAALLLVVAALAWFLVRTIRGRAKLRLPTEVAYVLPIYALLILGAWGHEPNVLRALIWCALASVPLIALSGLAAMRSPARTWLHVGVVGVANLALFYVIVWRCDLIDSLLMTAAPL